MQIDVPEMLDTPFRCVALFSFVYACLHAVTVTVTVASCALLLLLLRSILVSTPFISICNDSRNVFCQQNLAVVEMDWSSAKHVFARKHEHKCDTSRYRSCYNAQSSCQ